MVCRAGRGILDKEYTSKASTKESWMAWVVWDAVNKNRL